MSHEHKTHLTIGDCWRADMDEGCPRWGIYGHVSDNDVVCIVADYEGQFIHVVRVDRDWRRNGVCHHSGCYCDGLMHLEPVDGPGEDAAPYTWVTGAMP